MVIVAPRSAKLVEARGARFTLLLGYVFVLLGFATMFLLWNEGIDYWPVALGYAFVGVGVGFAGTPASHSLTGSVPVSRAGMASGTADLQRDLGGAFMQSIFGALLDGRLCRRRARRRWPGIRTPTRSRAASRRSSTKSFSSAEAVAPAVPAVRDSRSPRGQDVVPGRRRLGLPRGHRRRRRRRDARVLHVPAQGRRGAAARRVPRGGHRAIGLTPATRRPRPRAPPLRSAAPRSRRRS